MTIGSILNELKNINRRLSTNQYEFLGQIIGGDLFYKGNWIQKLKSI